mgnify:CR=1 FL=1
MDLIAFLEQVVIDTGRFQTTLGGILLAAFLIALLILARTLIVKRWFPHLMQQVGLTETEKRQTIRQINLSTILLILYTLLRCSGFDFDQFAYNRETERGSISLRVDSVFLSLWIAQVGYMSVLLFVEIFSWGSDSTQEKRSPITLHQGPVRERSGMARSSFRWFMYFLATLMIFSVLDIQYELYEFELGTSNDTGEVNTFTITLTKILETLLIVFGARLLAWLGIRYFLSRTYKKRDINIGSQFAINQLFTYLMYFVALIIILNVLGVNPTVVVGGTAALLLGVGLGLQQTFNDFFSGVLLLFERSVEVGDVVDIEGLNGTVKRIGLRTSEVQTRENMTVIVPNSKLVVNRVTNWSHNDEIARFHVGVGVAYGSDTALVKRLLVESASDHKKILKFPAPFVRFTDFGNSSLDFELHFWTREFIAIEDVKSDLRFHIDQLFREHHVTIPFPQRDLWLKQWPSGASPDAEPAKSD